MNHNSLYAATGVLMAAALVGSGCATKKFVRQEVGTAEQRAAEASKKNEQAISQLEEKTSKEVSRVEERAMTAENKATAAGRAAEQAQQSATQANQLAQNARQLAETTQTRLGEVSNYLENADKYKMVSSETVLFAFDKSNLTPESKQKLDSIIQNAAGMSRFVVEIEGFTDKTGPRDYNLALSRRRADEVVRYLVGKNIPLRRIHMVGFGEEPMMSDGAMVTTASTQPEQPERSSAAERREERKMARRVEVKIYAPEVNLASAQPGSTQTSAPTAQPSDSNPPNRPQ